MARKASGKRAIMIKAINRRAYNSIVDGYSRIPEYAREQMRRKPYDGVFKENKTEEKQDE